MSTYPKGGLYSRSNSFFGRRIVAVPVLAAVFWLFFQKGCVLTPDISPTHSITDMRPDSIEPAYVTVGKEELAESQVIPGTTTQPVEPRSQSLRHASALLKQAAVMLEKNERIAVRLILQAIAILKEHVLRGTDSSEYDHVSTGQTSSKRERWVVLTTYGVEVGPQHRHDLVRSTSTKDEGEDEMGLKPWR
jgi:hypothetical protein